MPLYIFHVSLIPWYCVPYSVVYSVDYSSTLFRRTCCRCALFRCSLVSVVLYSVAPHVLLYSNIPAYLTPLCFVQAIYSGVPRSDVIYSVVQRCSIVTYSGVPRSSVPYSAIPYLPLHLIPLYLFPVYTLCSGVFL